MKKIRNLLITFLGVLVLTGCAMKYETNMAITEDGKMNFALIAAYDKEFIKNMMSMGETEGEGTTTEPTDEQLATYFYSGVEKEDEATQEAQNLGFTLSRYQEGEFIGYKYLASFADIKAVSSDTDVTFDLSKVTESETPITQAKFFKKVGNTYTAAFVFDPANQKVDESDIEGSEGATGDTTGTQSNPQLEQALSQIVMDYSFKLTLPVAPTSHNATTVSEDGKTLTWTLSTTEVTNVNFVFDLVEKAAAPAPVKGDKLSDEMMMYIGIGAAAVVLIILIVVLIAVRSKKKNALVPETVNEVVTETTSVNEALNATPAADLGNTTIVDNATVEPAVQTPAVETPAVEATPVVETTPAVETPAVETTPVVETPVTETVVPVETPVVEIPTEQPVVETTPVVETPVIEAVATPETPVVEIPVEEPAIEVTPALEMPEVEATPVIETPVAEQPVAEQPVVETTPVVETPAVEQTPVIQTPAIDASVFELPTMPEMTEEVKTPNAE